MRFIASGEGQVESGCSPIKHECVRIGFFIEAIMKRLFIIISFLLLGIVTFNYLCQGQIPKNNSPKNLSGSVPRYISLAPSTTEILFSLGLDEEIVGVSSFCNYPPQAQEKAKIGDFSNPNIEKILSLKPDYIFCTGLEQANVVLKLRQLGLKVYVFDPVNIRELLATISETGSITNRREQAQELTQRMRQRIEEITSLTKLISQEKKPKVFIEIWHDPLTTAGEGSFVDELIDLAGGVNIAHNTKRPYSTFSQEEVIRRDPDYIIMAYMDKEQPVKLVEKRFGWDSISAVRNKRIYNDIDPDLLLRPGPRIVQGLEELYKKLNIKE
ncbi:MAG: cobalamin-binding protein [Candidatus Omnitrophota bacterium]